MKNKIVLLLIGVLSIPFTASAFYCPGPDCQYGTVEEYSIAFENLNYTVSLFHPWIKQVNIGGEIDGKVLTAELGFYVTDDGDCAPELVQAVADVQPLLGLFGEWTYLNGTPKEYEKLEIAPLLFADGKLCISIIGNDFILQEVEIEGTYCAAVPEPATMLLMGCGLLLGGSVIRRKMKIS